MNELLEIANKLVNESVKQEDINKYGLIAEIVSRPNWIMEVKTEYAIKILEDLHFEPANDKYVELMVEALNE